MKFNDLTFPHPVLGVGDSIESNVELLQPEIKSLQDVYEVKLNYKHNNADLKKLIDEKKAEYICEVNCSNTLFRNLFLSEMNNIEFQIPKKEVKGKVEFSCLLVAKEFLVNYSNSASHNDYSGYEFDIDKGDVLAFFGNFHFNADIKYEKLRAVSSFMEVLPKDDDTAFTDIDLESPKIIVKLPKSDYDIFSKNTISQNTGFSPIIHSSIVLNALTIALYNFDKYLAVDKLWAVTIEQRLKENEFKNISISESTNIPEIAQRLLGNPINRLLIGLNIFVELSNED